MEIRSKNTRQTNNSLYGKKHRYMLILKELNILKAQIDNEVLNDGLSKVRSQEIHDIYARVIVGLIEEGVIYQYVKDANDIKKDKIQLCIDGTIYECRNIDIREILKERYDIVMQKQYSGPSFKEIQNSREKNKDPELKNGILTNSEENIKNEDTIKSNDVKNLLLGIKDALVTKNEQEKNKEKEKKEKEKVTEYIPPKIYLNEQDEKKQNEKKVNKKINRFNKLMRSFFVTIAFLGVVIFGVCQIPGVKDVLNDGWQRFVQIITYNANANENSLINTDYENNNGDNKENNNEENNQTNTN